jgi:hypothetical protein
LIPRENYSQQNKTENNNILADLDIKLTKQSGKFTIAMEGQPWISYGDKG